ncbi:MAG: hypothetical protein E6R03_17860 [Hyphomicrobiaceae bacterium]|nr:MAG: hypothetical protein E6R03_17860 [Hyphomicrobiaceae bacterium]
MSTRAQIPVTTTQFDYFACVGGLNLVSPELAKKPGTLIDCSNFECELTGGYRRIGGYERFDGRARPSDQNYYTIAASVTSDIAVGDMLSGATSLATASVIVAAAAGSSTIVVAKLSGGPFVIGEALRVASVQVGTAIGPSISGGAPTVVLDAAWKHLAASAHRADIQAVPGSGPIRGVWMYRGVVYAFRDNATGTGKGMWRATPAGWTAVSLGSTLAYTSGTAIINDGDTVTGANSGASGVVLRVANSTGSWSSGSPSSGRIVLSSVSGTFQAGEALRVGGAPQAVAGNAQVATTLAPGGRYEFRNENFYGQSDTMRMYGVDGVNNAFEFDGSAYVPIVTGMNPDAPSHLEIHKRYLWLSFRGSLQHSSVGDPYSFSVITGAAEIATGADIVALASQIGDQTTAALLVVCRNRTYTVYGSSNADFVLMPTAPDIGAMPYTLQNLPLAIMLDDRGIVQAAASQNFGNFDSSTISQLVQPIIEQQRGKAVGSSIVRGRNQYRVFFDDGSGLILSFTGRKLLGITAVNYGRKVLCPISEEDSGGIERRFFGGDNGMVYEDDRGTSFDGADIEYYAKLAFNTQKSPRVRKRYRKAVLELRPDGYGEMSLTQDLQYTDAFIATPDEQRIAVDPPTTYWDTTNWDSVSWDARTIAPVRLELFGTGDNLALQIYGKTPYTAPFTLQSAIIHYTPRRHDR